MQPRVSGPKQQKPTDREREARVAENASGCLGDGPRESFTGLHPTGYDAAAAGCAAAVGGPAADCEVAGESTATRTDRASNASHQLITRNL